MIRHQCNLRGEDDMGNEAFACGGEFLCPGCENVCGYCCGCGDALGNLCDDCANDVVKAREAYGNGNDEFWFQPYAVPGTS